MRISIVYNNVVSNGRPTQDQAIDLKARWGFAAFIEYPGGNILFDTGQDAPLLLANLAAMGIETASIERVAISHNHYDHIGGLHGLLETGVKPELFLPPSCPGDLLEELAGITHLQTVSPGLELAPGITSTGEMDCPTRPDIMEQALILKTAAGPALLTGCAHPGIAAIAARACELSGEALFFVAGGFHLKKHSPDELRSVIRTLRKLGVSKAAPSHCTGDAAIAAFAGEFGDGFLDSGLGARIEL